MLAWWMLVPTLLAMTVALVLPGFMWLRAGVRSSLVAIGAAPAFTFGLITMLSVLYPALNIEWEPSTVMPVLGLSTLGGAIAWSLSFFRRTNGGFALNGVPLRQAIGVRVPIGGAQAAVRAVTWSAVARGIPLGRVATRDGRGRRQPSPAVGSDLPPKRSPRDPVRQGCEPLRWPSRTLRRAPSLLSHWLARLRRALRSL